MVFYIRIEWRCFDYVGLGLDEVLEWSRIRQLLVAVFRVRAVGVSGEGRCGGQVGRL